MVYVCFLEGRMSIYDEAYSSCPTVIIDCLLEKANENILENQCFTVSELSTASFPSVVWSLILTGQWWYFNWKTELQKVCTRWALKILSIYTSRNVLLQLLRFCSAIKTMEMNCLTTLWLEIRPGYLNQI